MGTVTAVGTDLVLKNVVEVLGPSGTYEKRRIALRNEYGQVVLAAKKLETIETTEQAEEATQYGRLLQTAAKETEAFFKKVKSQIDDIKKPVLAAEKEDVGPYNAEKSRLGTLLTGYQAEQRRLREIEEQKAREAAQKQAEEEALQRALELAAAGESEASEAILEEEIIAAPVIIQAVAPKPTGSVGRKNYGIRITNLKLLVDAVSQGKVFSMAVTANESWLGSKARNEKEAFSVPGVELVITESTSFRS